MTSGDSTVDRFEGMTAPAPPAELPGWEEWRERVEWLVGAVPMYLNMAADQSGEQLRAAWDEESGDPDAMHFCEGEVRAVLAFLLPFAERQQHQLAEARAGGVASKAREGAARAALERLERDYAWNPYPNQQMCSCRSCGGVEPRRGRECRFALLSAPAPPPSALLELIEDFEESERLHRSRHAELCADRHEHETLAEVYESVARRLRSAIVLPPAEGSHG